MAITTTRGYVAVNLSLAPQTDKMEYIANGDMVIEGTNGAIVTLKKGEHFFVVRAGSLGPNMFYLMKQDVKGVKKCSCASTRPCVHEIYVATGKPLAEIRAENAARAKARKTANRFRASEPARIAQMLDEKPAPIIAAPQIANYTFGNQNRAFSILR